MIRTARFLVAFTIILLFSQVTVHAEENSCNLKIGVTLHPYYSWVKNIVGNAAEVVPLIPPGVDPHSYQPVASDMERLEGLDAVVVNGVGHDEFVKPMLKAIDNPDLTIINTSKGLPLLPAFGEKHYAFEGEQKISYNSHTYIAITGAIQQMQYINRSLTKLCPDQAALFNQNLRAYSTKLRSMLADTLKRLEGLDLNKAHIATVHDGYSYLFQELGIDVSAVVQPRHGVRPSARQLQDTIKRIKKANVNILFGELDYEKKYVDIIYQETGCRLYALSHISNGEYTKEHFEQSMQQNLDTIVTALNEVAGTGKATAPANIQESISKQMQDNAQTMQEKMRQAVQGNLQNKMPGVQQQMMQQNMGSKMQQMQETMRQNVQQAVPDMQQKQMQNSMTQQMQDTAQKVQGTMQEKMQQAVPDIQQKQMTERMSQQMEKAAQQVQQNLPAPTKEAQEKP